MIDTCENSQKNLPSKYSKFSGTGSAKPGDKFVKQTSSQNVGNSQNLVANPSWKTGRSSQTNGTPCRCWLCNKVGHRAVHCKKRGPHRSAHSRKNVVLVENQRLVSTMSKLNQSNTMQPCCNRSAKSIRYQFDWRKTRSGHTGF